MHEVHTSDVVARLCVHIRSGHTYSCPGNGFQAAACCPVNQKHESCIVLVAYKSGTVDINVPDVQWSQVAKHDDPS